MSINHRKGVTDIEISALEKDLKISLPSDYKDFLKTTNGLSVTDPDYFDISFKRIDCGHIAFGSLFPTNDRSEVYDIESFNHEFIDELDFIESDKIAIGEDGGGNPYVLLIKKDIAGVYYWDRTHLHAENSTEADIKEVGESGDLYRIATSFDEFLTILAPYINKTKNS
ncbi:SMI1/KNR4 family protein [Pseudomonas luteola]|uniref:SMI1/KNR4 family protein n=1 Tax=Pseudomonas luteola TaxID=47886 RepID=A0ABS0MNX3_PSELU|nr:SMI1/KNR4 family protein [Pseudomonas luteola]MBH3438419.1 SMI1/KNR4 family protein [Pseudomonas luteola]